MKLLTLLALLLLATCVWASCESGQRMSLYDATCIDCEAGKAGAGCSTTCPRGKYSLAGASVCVECAEGKYGSEVGLGTSECSGTCGLGKFSLQGATECESCPLGKYGGSEGLADISCTGPCPAGRYGNEVGLSACVKCQSGTYQSTTGQTNPNCESPCEAGKYSTEGSSACTRCAAGYDGSQPDNHSRGYTTEQCGGKCQAGKYSGEDDVECLNCAAGSYGKTSGLTTSTCSGSCQIGRYSDAGSLSCPLCAEGKYSSGTGQESCSDCATGKYGQSTGLQTSDCSGDCPPGTYSALVASRECERCVAGKHRSSPGAKTGDDCEKCDPNYYSLAGSKECSKCKEGYSSEGLADGSLATTEFCGGACPAGKYSEAGGSCTDCPAGKYGQTTASVTEDCDGPCPAGKYSLAGFQSCLDCPQGKYGANGASTSAECEGSCSAGKYSIAGSESCYPCDPGRFGSEGQTDSACEGACAAGYFGNGATSKNNTCSGECPKGKYSEAGSSSCNNCPAGKMGGGDVIRTDDECNGSCPAGKYSTEGSLSCQDCPAREYQDEVGQPSCKRCPNSKQASVITGQGFTLEADLVCVDCKCPVGNSCSIQTGGAIDECSPCEEGTYGPSVGAGECLDCPEGKVASDEGSPSCGTCEEGQQPNSEKTGCEDCVAGKFALPGQTTCTDCAPGKASQKKSGKCEYCGPGKDVDKVAWECKGCSQGKYSLGDVDDCSPCEIGKMQNDPNSTYCEVCSAGQIPKDDKTGCLSCEEGKYASYGGSECNICPEGKWSRIEAQQCSPVQPGHEVVQNNSLRTGQSPCTEGHYSPGGLDSCQTCPSEEFSNGLAISCSSCVPGKYNSRNADSSLLECQDCPEGKVAPLGTEESCVYCNAINGLVYSGSKTACTFCAAGTYASVIDNGNGGRTESCAACPSGKFSPGGTSACEDCGDNTYSTLNLDGRDVLEMATCKTCTAGEEAKMDKTGCNPCASGKVSIAGGRCEPCPAGSYQNEVVCEVCEGGKYSYSSGTTSCTQCDDGKSSQQGAQSCTPCESGTMSTGGASCEACKPGKSSGDEASECADCLAGKWSGTKAASCTNCDAGKYQTDNQCEACAAGKRSEAGSATCSESCPMGTFGERGSAMCVSCVPGRYSDAVELSSCKYCDPGKFSDSVRSTTCESCSVGKYSLNGADSCLSCQKGEYSEVGKDRCIICDAGYHNNSDSSACTPCIAGKWSIAGSTTCQDCAAGFVAPSEGTSNCQYCEAGKYAGKVDEPCAECPKGTFSSGGAEECTPCEGNTYTNTKGQKVCQTCGNGEDVNDDKTDCVACQDGWESSAGSDCSICGSGYSSTGGEFCNVCVGGKKALEGSSICIDCLAGEFSSLGSSSCDNCTAGTYSGVGKDSCTFCEEGKFSGPRASTCQDCAPGSISSIGASECIKCAAGKIENNNSCEPCAPGTVSSEGSTSCDDSCPPGTYGELGGATCKECQAGKFSSGGEGSCELCIAGKFSAAGSTSCTNCTKGRYSGMGRDNVFDEDGEPCDKCGNGLVSPLGSPECTTCEAGTIPVEDNASCRDCESGKKSGVAATECVACDAGTYAEENKSNACTRCELGTYSRAGSSNCTGCTAGKIASSLRDECVDVEAGQYSDDKAATSIKCPAGTWCPRGSSEPTYCEPGTFSGAGSDRCTKCESSSIQPEAGQASCNLCPLSQEANEDRTKCICKSFFFPVYGGNSGDDLRCVCGPGYTLNDDTCTRCSSGTFKEQQGNHPCTPCNDFLLGSFSTAGGHGRDDGDDEANNSTLVDLEDSAAPISKYNCTCEKGDFKIQVTNMKEEVKGAPTDFEDNGGYGFCLTCPEGTLCTERGLTIETIPVLPGYWRSDLVSYNVVQCRKDFACAQSPVASIEQWSNQTGIEIPKNLTNEKEKELLLEASQCEVGHEGPLCDACREGYNKGSYSDKCEACKDEEFSVPLPMWILLGCLVIFLSWAISRPLIRKRKANRRMRNWESKSEGSDSTDFLGNIKMESVAYKRKTGSKSFRSLQTKFKILMTFYQITGQFESLLVIEFPPIFAGFMRWVTYVFSFDAFRFFSLGCFMEVNFFTKLVVFTVAPLFLAGAIFLFFLFRLTLVAGDSEAVQRSRDNLYHRFLFLTYIIFSSVSMTIFETFNCVQHGDDKTYYLFSDSSIDCGTEEYKWYLRYARLMVGVYPLGITALYTYVLISHRDALQDPKRIDNPNLDKIRFLWDMYDLEVWWFEIFECIRRLSLTGLLIFLTPGSTSQIIVALMMSLFYCCFFFHFRPYEVDADDDLGNICQLAIFVTVFSCLIMKVEVDETDGYDQNLFGLVLIVVNIAGVVILLARFLVGPFKKGLKVLTKKLEHSGSIKGITADHDDPLAFIDYFERLALSEPEDIGYKKVVTREVSEERLNFEKETGAFLEWRNSEGNGPIDEGRVTFKVNLPIDLIEEYLVNPHFEYRKGVAESFKVGESTEEMRTVYKAVRLSWPFSDRDTLMTEYRAVSNHTEDDKVPARVIVSRSVENDALFSVKKSKQRGYVRANISLKGFLLIPDHEMPLFATKVIHVTTGDSNSMISDLMARSYIPRSMKSFVKVMLGLEKVVNGLQKLNEKLHVEGEKREHTTRIGRAISKTKDRIRGTSDAEPPRGPLKKQGSRKQFAFDQNDDDDHLANLYQTEEHKVMRESIEEGKKARTRKRDIIKSKASAGAKRASQMLASGGGSGKKWGGLGGKSGGLLSGIGEDEDEEK
ncbi:hypothetical protein TrVE_jg1080 [Triparma verrucosa]|uniref:EGF-like domain-containing protein n=1 Tax=Triparma verrucosa TaxID=1606542 RepID=A0A9W7C951_9STRA|nr:hypothetical protein TrVE_jg1080 [Triparma verrucosa]